MASCSQGWTIKSVKHIFRKGLFWHMFLSQMLEQLCNDKTTKTTNNECRMFTVIDNLSWAFLKSVEDVFRNRQQWIKVNYFSELVLFCNILKVCGTFWVVMNDAMRHDENNIYPSMSTNEFLYLLIHEVFRPGMLFLSLLLPWWHKAGWGPPWECINTGSAIKNWKCNY